MYNISERLKKLIWTIPIVLRVTLYLRVYNKLQTYIFNAYKIFSRIDDFKYDHATSYCVFLSWAKPHDQSFQYSIFTTDLTGIYIPVGSSDSFIDKHHLKSLLKLSTACWKNTFGMENLTLGSSIALLFLLLLHSSPAFGSKKCVIDTHAASEGNRM